ncbi:outer membrane protein TolC [gut metagenome]|uniref:Outer membrane protein TolC n=1 Tax=gut metagenome TaxID=749906 RepID=J9GND0_9ZZZZ
MFTLRSFLTLGEGEELVPQLPEQIETLTLAYSEVLRKALERNAFTHNLRHRQLEADYEVARAKGNRRQVSLFAQVGLTGYGDAIAPAYTHTKDNQVVEVGVRLPFLDWGKRRGQVKVAESRREVVRQQIRKEEADFQQRLFVLTERFNNQQDQLHIAREADKIARKRYQNNVETFLIGRISTLDLNDAQSGKDEARRKYISELLNYWYAYYQLRSLTLWDFATHCNIDADFDEIVR